VTAQGTRSVLWAENKINPPAPARTRSSGKYAALREAPFVPHPSALLTHTEAPQRPGTGPMTKAEFYAYCKRTGQLALFFAMYPGG
jgi:hypothetical protein